MYHLTLKSSNGKTGPIPVSTSGRATCPGACPFKANGCYGDDYRLRMHWDRVSDGRRGGNWHTFCQSIGNLPAGQLWRHNQAGDLPGPGNTIDTAMLGELVKANTGKKGFTYTHKPMDTVNNRDAVKRANERGLTVNLSANTLTDADRLSELGIAPVVVILAEPGNTRTPRGRRVVQCPGPQQGNRVANCKSCGLCQVQRRAIIGFAAHGAGKSKVAAIARG